MWENISGVIFCLLGLSAMLFSFHCIMPFLYDYKFSHEGVDIVIFCKTTIVFRIKKENITAARIEGWFTADSRNLGHISLANRVKRRCLVLDTTGLCCWILTPADPDAALAALSLKNHH